MAELLSPTELNRRTLDALRIDGEPVFVLTRLGRKPLEARLELDDLDTTAHLYVSNITHGGRGRATDEYRIQTTRKVQLNSGVLTAILGREEDLKVFAGYAPRPHAERSGRSDSLQVRLSTLEEAAAGRGIETETKSNDEVVAAFAPAYLRAYLRGAEAIHELGQAASAIFQAALPTAPAPAPEPLEMASLPPDRRRVLRTTREAIRDQNFRGDVLTAYGDRCAICGLQMRLLEAAHIIPVSEQESVDIVPNGIALCRIHHRAYDLGYVRLRYGEDTYIAEIIEGLREHLEQIGAAGGFESFAAGFPCVLSVPVDPGLRPNPDFIRRGNEVRPPPG